jgi:hypothetical protein
MDIFPQQKDELMLDRLTIVQYFVTLPPMFRSSRKVIAVLMLLWLPLFNGSALAATVSMQTQQEKCHEAAVSHAMHHMNMDGHHQHHGEMPSTTDEHSPSCNTCGVCHLACTGYLAVASVEVVAMQTAARETTPYLVAFRSVTFVPLLPPPLVRA